MKLEWDKRDPKYWCAVHKGYLIEIYKHLSGNWNLRITELGRPEPIAAPSWLETAERAVGLAEKILEALADAYQD